MKGAWFDILRFRTWLDIERATRGLDWKEVAEETGVSASTLSRTRVGKKPDADALVVLADWSDVDLRDFLVYENHD